LVRGNTWTIRISAITLLLAMVPLSFITSFSKQKAAQPTMPKFSELSHEDRHDWSSGELLSQLLLINDTVRPASEKRRPICRCSSD
jgi:hypothetical protein